MRLLLASTSFAAQAPQVLDHSRDQVIPGLQLLIDPLLLGLGLQKLCLLLQCCSLGLIGKLPESSLAHGATDVGRALDLGDLSQNGYSKAMAYPGYLNTRL